MTTLPCPLASHAQNTPDAIAIVTDEGPLSYQKVHERVHSLTLALQREKVTKGTRVAFIATPHVATVFLLFALFRLQAIACPLNPKLPERQIPCMLNDLRATHFYLPEELPWQVGIPCSTTPTIEPSSLATFLFTSGSSAKPKIATHSWSNHYYNALGAIDALGLNENSLYHLSLPLFHVSGIAILFRCWLSKSCLLVSSLPLEQVLQRYLVTHLSLVPTQLYRLLENALPPPPSLCCALLGGAPASPALLERASHWPIYLTYGMTEMSSMISLKRKVLSFREVKIEEGEIYVRGKPLFQGYLGEEPPQDWFATKDCGRFDGEQLIITGRKDRQFISGGENIQPEEIEQALCSLPFITKARVLPQEDPEFGQRPCAYIESTSYDLTEICRRLSFLLPSFKHPVEVHPFTSREKEF